MLGQPTPQVQALEALSCDLPHDGANLLKEGARQGPADRAQGHAVLMASIAVIALWKENKYHLFVFK